MSFLQWTVPQQMISNNDVFLAALWQHAIEGTEENDDELIIFAQPELQNEIQTLLQEWNISTQPITLANTNWNSQWESTFQPIIIEKYCGIRAHFHAPIPQVEHEIIITPRMSFGTGHHATTQMMIQAMRNLNFKNTSVFDFGTGTGILAIHAEQLGAQKIIGIDNDPNCVENANDNLVQNGCSKVLISQNDINTYKGDFFDILLANINKNILIAYMNQMSSMLNDKGKLLLSGIMPQDKEDIVKHALQHQLQYVSEMQQGNWMMIHLQKI